MVIIYLVPPLLAGSSGLPEDCDGAGSSSPHIWPCSAWGLPCTLPSPAGTVVSYTTFSPLPSWGQFSNRDARSHKRTVPINRRYIFCGTFLWVAPSRCYRPRRPSEPGLSSFASTTALKDPSRQNIRTHSARDVFKVAVMQENAITRPAFNFSVGTFLRSKRIALPRNVPTNQT